MRSDFITQLKTYIQSQPDTDSGLAKIKEHVRELGASEEEFTEALRQVVYEAMGKRYTSEPHELMLEPESELAERPEHELMKVQMQSQVVDQGEQTTPTLRDLRDEVRSSKSAELTAFQNELAQTKEELIATFEAEMEKQRQEISSNHAAFEKQSTHTQTITRTASAVLAIAIFLLGGITLLFIVTSKQPQSKLPSAAPSLSTITKPFLSQVYASTQVVDPIKVFSFPPTHVSLVEAGTPRKQVIGFFPYWMLPVEEKVPLNNLTAISLFGLDMNGKGNIMAIDPSGNPDQGWQMYNDPKLTQLLTRANAQHLQIFYTLKMFDNTNIENLVRSNEAQTVFISNAIHIINSKNLRGINLDFEYTGNPPADVRDGFTRLVQNLSAELKRQVPGSELTIDTYVTAAADQKLFDIPAVAQTADALIVMGYDIHTPSGEPGAIAPMESEVGIIGLMQSYLDKISPEKLILAVPYYGYDWTVPKSTNTGTIVTYAQALDQSKSSQLQWDDSSQSPYYTYRNQADSTNHEVHFDNARSLGIKYDFVNQKNLLGVGIWALGYDGQNTDLESLLIEKFGSPIASGSAK